MSAWLLAVSLCAPVSAAVVAAGGAAAPAAPVSAPAGGVAGFGAAPIAILAVPGAPLLAPSLDLAASIRAFPASAAASLPAGDARFAPLPALPAAAAAGAVAAPGAPGQDAPAQTADAPVSRESPRTVAAGRSRDFDDDAAGRVPEEAIAALGRLLFDQAADRALLADGSAPGAPGVGPLAGVPGPRSSRRDPLRAAAAGGRAEGDALRDAVAAPLPAAAAPAAVISYFRLPAALGATPLASGVRASAASGRAILFERLSLELGSGLVVKVRSALGSIPPAAAPAASGRGAWSRGPALSAVAPGLASIAATGWLQRRGVLESLSASEAAASGAAALVPSPSAPSAADGAFAPGDALGAARRSAAAAARDRSLDPAAPARALGWWGLALLPGVLALLKERM